jgi:hypothetical protein
MNFYIFTLLIIIQFMIVIHSNFQVIHLLHLLKEIYLYYMVMVYILMIHFYEFRFSFMINLYLSMMESGI